MALETIQPVVETDEVSRWAQRAEFIRRSLGGRVRELRLAAHEGGVILWGESYTYHVKQLAQHLVMDVLHFPVLANHIRVLPPETRKSGG